MSFIRPEAQAAIWRWREALIGAGALTFGGWWAFSGADVTRWIGMVVAIGALALLVAGLQRGRFRGRSGGIGVVRTDEGQVAYFGPLSGGVVAFSEMTSLIYDPSGKPPHWVLSQPGQPDLHIPVDAEGADALFDVFTRLPGLRTEALLAALKQRHGQKFVLWQRPATDALTQLN